MKFVLSLLHTNIIYL